MPKKSPVTPAAADWLTPQGAAATPTYLRRVQEEAMRWWNHHQRLDLPWRTGVQEPHTMQSTPHASSQPRYNPYHIWVSEVMSQQTQLGTVVRYYTVWMNKFPTIEALAKASEEDVRSVWSGMGYYRRAMYLLAGAQYLVKLHGDKAGPVRMPTTAQELLKVPGIGAYTSAAIASMCYAEPIIAVDGNVVRVISRLRGERGVDPKNGKDLKRVFMWGQQLMLGLDQLPCEAPGALNQALMELGASVCRPAGAPQCTQCPLADYCGALSAQQRGDIAEIEGVIPMRGTPPKKRNTVVVAVVHETPDGRFVLVRRPESGLLGGMLEFPSVSIASSSLGDGEENVCPEMSEEDALTYLCPTVKGAGTSRTTPKCVGSVTHIFSHINMTVRVYAVTWSVKEKPGGSLFTAGRFKGVQSRHEDELCASIATGLDSAHGHVKDYAEASDRMCVMSEAELKSAEASRLVIKILHKVHPKMSLGKRGRN